MEPISLSLGLVGSFVACVDCFEYIRIGRNFGEDYQTSVIKLDLVRLRFTRWGEAVGIAQSDENIAVAHLKSSLPHPDKNIEVVKKTFGEILRLFEKAGGTSSHFESRAPGRQILINEDIDLEPESVKSLHEGLRSLAVRRQKRSSILQKTTWALYGRKEFATLIQNLTDLVSGLVELVPQKPQKELCRREVEEIEDDRSLVFLDDVLRRSIVEDKVVLDGLLQETAMETIEQRKRTMTTTAWKRSRAGDGSRIMQGDHVASDYGGQVFNRDASHLVKDSTLGKNVVFHQGNRYGGSFWV